MSLLGLDSLPNVQSNTKTVDIKTMYLHSSNQQIKGGIKMAHEK